MKTIVELKIPSKYGYEKIAMDTAASLAHYIGFNRARIDDLKTAVSEACINAIEHGNRNRYDTSVWIAFSLLPESLEINIRDEGADFLGCELPKNLNMDAKLNELESPRGLGLFLIQALMDEVKWEKLPDGAGVELYMLIKK